MLFFLLTGTCSELWRRVIIFDNNLLVNIIRKNYFAVISTVEPLLQARDFIFAYDNLCIGVLRKNYLDLAVEPVGNPLDRRYVYYLLAGRPEKLQRVELRINIIESHVDVILPLVFKIQACKS